MVLLLPEDFLSGLSYVDYYYLEIFATFPNTYLKLPNSEWGRERVKIIYRSS